MAGDTSADSTADARTGEPGPGRGAGAEAAVEGFGRVSRRVGVVFRYLLLAATLVGIVALAVLLAYVTWDAVQPGTADPGYYLTYLLTLVLPTLAVGGYLHRRTPRGLTVGLNALGVPAVGLLFGSGLALLFVSIVLPILWFAYVVALVAPVLLVVAVSRAIDLPFLARLVGGVALVAASLAILPFHVATLPLLPADWLIVVLTVGAPVAAAVRGYLDGLWDDRTPDLAGAGTVALAVAGAYGGALLGIGTVPGVILAVTVVAPALVYAAVVVREDPANRAGLVLAGVILVGALAGGLATDLLGVAGPQSWVDWQFLTNGHSNTVEDAGVYPAIAGSILLMLIVVVVSFPVGVGAAVYLEEYATESAFTRLVTVNISNLAGVPSIVYGLLGLGLFVRYGGSDPGTVLVGGLTLSLLILPIVIISSQEAIRAVPSSQRQASYGMGATRWQTVRNVVLPRAFPGILTGTILSLGRAIGETAPLLVIGAPNVFDLPTALDSRVGAMPLQIYVWATTFADPEFYQKAIPAAVIVLLTILLAMNSVAIVLRNRYQREAKS